MANHRAEKPTSRRSVEPRAATPASTSSSGGKRRAAKPTRVSRVKSSAEPTTTEIPAVYPGAPFAPAARAAAPAERVAPERVAPVQPEPTVALPRLVEPPAAPRPPAPVREPGARRAAAPAPRPRTTSRSGRTGRLSLPEFPVPDPTEPPRSLSTHTRGRKRLFPGLPSAPSIVGAAALALAAAGAVTVSSNGFGSELASGDIHKFSSQASVLNGASSIGSSDALSGRKRAVSRDSEREAAQSAEDQQLQAAAEAKDKARRQALAALAASAEQHASYIAKNAWQLPIPMGVYHLTSRFGECSVLWSHCHTGLDFAAPSGTPIHAVAGGTVTETGWGGAYGNRTEITLDDGTQLWYCHQTSINVSPGQRVEPGQFIGTVGATGNVTGPHLHLEVRPGGGDPVDPYAALVAHGVNPG